MSIERVASGRWRAVVRYKGVKRASKPTTDYNTARLDEASLLVEMGGTPAPPPEPGKGVLVDLFSGRHAYDDTARTIARTTVADLLVGHLDDCTARRLSPTTLDQYARSIRNVPATFSARYASEITPLQVEALYSEMRAAGAGEHLLVGVHKALSGAFARGLRVGLVKSNPVALARKPLPAVTEVVPPTRETVEAVMKAAVKVNPLLPLAFRVLANTGMRRGELCALRWDVFNADCTVVTVRRSHVEVGGKTVVRPTKTGTKGWRPVSIAPELAEALRTYRETQAGSADCFTFSHDGGVTPWRLGYVSLAWARLCPDHTLHSCRHLVASTWLAGGVAPSIVSGLLGQSGSAMLKRYGHLVPGQDAEAAARFAL